MIPESVQPRKSGPGAACLLLLLGLGGCAFLPPAQPGGGSAPRPELAVRYPWAEGVRWPPDLERLPEAEELSIAADIDTLLTGEFDAYPPAARRLIDRGEPAVPLLGHALERHPAPTARRERVEIVLGPVLRPLPPPRLLAWLASPYPSLRAAAARAGGEERVDALGLRLIELLEDREPEVRRAAIAALRRISGQFLGYEPDGPATERAESAARWREYWATRPPPGVG